MLIKILRIFSLTENGNTHGTLTPQNMEQIHLQNMLDYLLIK